MEKNYETLTLHGQGYDLKANEIKRLEVHGQGHDIHVKNCDKIDVHGMGNQIHKEGKYDSIDDALKDAEYEDIFSYLEDHKIYFIDGQGMYKGNTPDDILKREFEKRFGNVILKSCDDKMLKEELERRGWEVKCTRTKVEEL